MILSLAAAVLVAALPAEVWAQTQKEITGTVTDSEGAPVAGAYITVGGTSTATITGADGRFRLAAREGQTLNVALLGYKSQTVVVGGASDYAVRLEPDTTLLDEVVVVGYGTVNRADITGSVASVRATEIEGFKSSSVVDALGGQMAGIQITRTDGSPGAGFDVKIRGIGTMTGDASPLYIVDGFQVDNIDYLAISDIAAVDVLKDASASAIYGARAANGVVLVTTKSGREGRSVVSYSGSASYRRISKYLDMLSPYEFVKLQMEINPSKYAMDYFSSETDGDGNFYKYRYMDDYIGLPGVDWQKETFKPTWSQDHNVSVGGGTKESQYNASFSNYGENGIFTNSSFQKTTAKLRLNQNITKNVRLDATVNYSRSVKKGVGTSAEGGRFNMLAQILSAGPTGGLKLSDEELLHEAIDPLELESGGSSLAQVNPIVQAQSVTNNRQTDQWVANAGLTVNIVKGLSLRVSGSYNISHNINDRFFRYGSKEAFRAGNNPYGDKTMSKSLRWGTSNYLTYKFRKKGHSFDVMAGQDITANYNEGMTASAEQFFTDQFGTGNLGIGAKPVAPASYIDNKLLLSYYGRVNYSWKDRYYLTTTMRADGSSVFADNHKWGWFPSFSASWRGTEEKFMKSQKLFSNLKIRAGYGMVGNDRIPNFLSLPLYSSSKYGLAQETVIVLKTKHIPNPDIKWEASETYNVGLDVGFAGGRINATLDLFLKNTKDLLLLKSLPYVSGFGSRMENIGKIRNKGLELTVNSVNINRGGFLWTTDFNISFIRNSLVSLQGGEKQVLSNSNFYSSEFTDYDYIARVGRSLGLMYGFEFDGVYQESDFNRDAATGAYTLKAGVTDISAYSGEQGGVKPGFVKYKDRDGDGVITDRDRTVIGNGTPDFYGGITNTFSYRGVDLSFMLQFNYGNDVFNATRIYATQSRSERNNMRGEVADRWTPENANNRVPSAKGYIRGDVYSRFIEDGSFLRFKNITLGYTLPQKWTRKAFVERARVYVSGQNLFVVSKYSGYDPEVSMRATNPMTPGVDWGAYPTSKVVTFGLDVQF
jgi:TonB-linked SusC/RagA family outer membrane protein